MEAGATTTMTKVIKNGNKLLKKTVGTSEEAYEPTSAEEKLNRRNEMKARGTLLMVLSNKDQLKFHSYQDAKLLIEAIKKRYGGNKEPEKVQKTLLKQQYENFTASNSETLDQTFDRLQKLISHLEIQGETELETVSLDDLYNNLKTYEHELLGSSNTNQNPQNMAFVSSNSTSSTNEADTTLVELVLLILKEMAMLTIRAIRFMKRTCMNLDMNGQRFGFDKSKVECFNCHKNGHFARECRALKNQDNRGREYGRKTVPMETPTENFLIAQNGIGGYNWSYQAKEEILTNNALMALTSSGSLSSSESEVYSCSKSCMKAYANLKE
uniref:Ribonuclease H-like domain-containing protein n=1 Tax=Tanacetum cinerariifolium TaxID=118510 RepID=A0A699IVC1_TANCI|nr:ribonuclease H-like domain-containing protein [Tanacetum cinerariifolium]